MEYVRRACFYYVITAFMLLLAVTLALPERARGECLELKIVEYEDRVEAVCVGEPLTEAQQKAKLEEQQRNDREIQRLNTEMQKRKQEEDRLAKAKAEAEAAALRKSQAAPPVPPRQPLNRNTGTNPQMLFK